MDYEKKDIDPALLKVDIENFRIGEQDSPRHAYHAMLEEEGDDLVNLSQDIIQYGLSPAELFIVMPDPDPDEKGHYIVCEGNRRITSIRLLETPALASSTPQYKKFQELAKEYRKNPVKLVSCVVLPDKETAFVWIERKHLDLGGRGVAKWGAPATARADAFRGKVRPSKAVMDHLKKHGALTAKVEAALTRKTTNLDRVFQMPYVSSALGIRLKKDGAVTFDNGDTRAGNRLLRSMVESMSKADFKVDLIKNLSQRKDWIDQFSAQGVTGTPPTTGGTRAAKAAASRQSAKSAISQKDRKMLALKGKESKLVIKESRLQSLYEEAQNIDVNTLTNSAAILTRVFLELATDFFLLRTKEPLPASWATKGKRKWTDVGIPLIDKVRLVLSKLDPLGKDHRLKKIRQGLSDPDALHSIDALHDFIHNLKADANPHEQKVIWQRWHEYFAMLFDQAP